jgi:pyridoxine 5-phosphate synthase
MNLVSMTRLSVNINKIALIRNARGGNMPDLLQVAKDCEAFGAHGITVHPRPDERHIRFADLPQLKAIVTTELNIEGNPTPDFMRRVLAVKPHQCTLVPDAPSALTSDQGWDTLAHQSFLKDICLQLREAGIRSAIFINADPRFVEGAKAAGADRIELFTGAYAEIFPQDPWGAVAPFSDCSRVATSVGIGLNAGHDLNLDNLSYFCGHTEGLLEVSIGHALVCDALYFGLANTIQMYLGAISHAQAAY